jgi:hypothetical protein
MDSSDDEKPMIDVEGLHSIVRECLFKDEEIGSDGNPKCEAALVEGVVQSFGFHKGRVLAARDRIVAMLRCLDSKFEAGASFLEAPFDKNRNQWGEHRDVNELMCLGMAIGVVEYAAPKLMWPMLPGGMPYYVVKFD